MRLAFVTPRLHGGGAEFVVRRWSSGLRGLGHDVFVYSYDPTQENRVTEEPLRLRRFPHRSRPARVLLLPLWLRQMAARDELDVLICVLTFSNLAGVAGLCLGGRSRTRVVISERSVMSTALALNARQSWLKKTLARRLYPLADAALAISHPVAADLIGGFRLAPAKVHVVPNPVVTNGTARHDPPDVPRRIHVAFVGRLVKDKSPLLVLETLAELRIRGADVSGTFLGDGPLRSAVAERAVELGIPVRLPGWREPWWEAASDVDCVLLPSAIEGFANVLVEAAVVGIPAVARSGALGVADAVIPGVTGELASGGTPAELADAVVAALRPRTAVPLEMWLERFSDGASTRQLVRVLETVAANGSARTSTAVRPL